MPVYRVESGTVYHGDGRYDPGDTFEAELSDAQLASMEVVPVDDDGEGEDADEDGTASDDAADGDTEESGVPEELTAEWIDAAAYAELRTAAGRYDDVNGNWGADRLRAELHEKASESE